MKVLRGLLTLGKRSIAYQTQTNYLEYRVRYRNDEWSGVMYGKTFDQLISAMQAFKINDRYLTEGFDGLLWCQIQKSQDYDIN